MNFVAIYLAVMQLAQVIRMVLFLAYLGELQVDFVPLSLVVMQRLLE